MSASKRKRVLFIVISILILTALACLGSGSSNGGGNTQQDANAGNTQNEGPDLEATSASLEKTQAYMDTEAAKPEPATDTPKEEAPEPTTAPDTSGEIDWANLQHEDDLYVTDFETSDGWTSFSIPNSSDNYDIWVDSGFMYIGIEDKNTTVYAVYDPLYVPREMGD